MECNEMLWWCHATVGLSYGSSHSPGLGRFVKFIPQQLPNNFKTILVFRVSNFTHCNFPLINSLPQTPFPRPWKFPLRKISMEIYKLYLPISPSQQCHYKTRISQSWNAWLSAGCSVEGNSWFALVSLHCRRPKLTSGGTYAPRGIKPGRTAGWLRTNANQLQFLLFVFFFSQQGTSLPCNWCFCFSQELPTSASLPCSYLSSTRSRKVRWHV